MGGNVLGTFITCSIYLQIGVLIADKISRSGRQLLKISM